MPIVDESLSWGYVEIPYITEFHSHVIRFHCREMDNAGSWSIPSGSELTVMNTVTNFLQAAHALFPTGTTFGDFVVWKNNPYPTPTEFWFTNSFSAPADAPSSTSRAAWQLTINFKTTGNRKAKFTILDVDIGITIPFVRVAASFGAGGLDTFSDYVIANSNIVTIDGDNISSVVNATGTLNNTAEDRYGKAANTA